MKLTMLGTGAALALKYYNTCFLLEEDGRYLLVDGGGGNELLKRLKSAGADWADIKDIFVTHKHIDHMLGIIWLIRLICNALKKGNYRGEARIYAHEELCALIKNIACALLQEKESRFIGNGLYLIPVADGDKKTVFGRKITFFDIHSSKAKQFGFSLEYAPGKKLVCCGDEPCNAFCAPHVLNADWLLHEAFCLFSQADIFKPYEKNHSTVKDACETAEKLNVKNLVLYHTEDRSGGKRKELYLKEGSACYGGGLYIPEDLESIEII
ncbi:MBL fold metallo-hydrolase [Candidatus Proelusimicrobium excrementi]|uniref:MBL fold metallo-hydrolase n=1 Tax=Candidatus Proelusimicrobium excrementi TaxID=3416222 RepID=UPI003D0B21BF